MHFDDLTPYSYSGGFGEPADLNVGWLDASAPFPTGEVDLALVEKLGRLVSKPVNLERGIHDCPFCENAPKMSGHRCTVAGKALWLGSGEIRVKSRDGKIFAAPDMIYHYVLDHNYQPPQAFLDALSDA